MNEDKFEPVVEYLTTDEFFGMLIGELQEDHPCTGCPLLGSSMCPPDCKNLND